MNEKEMVAHIKALTRVIEKQTEYSEQMTRKFYNIDRHLSVLSFRVGELQGMNRKVDE